MPDKTLLGGGTLVARMMIAEKATISKAHLASLRHRMDLTTQLSVYKSQRQDESTERRRSEFCPSLSIPDNIIHDSAHLHGAWLHRPPDLATPLSCRIASHLFFFSSFLFYFSTLLALVILSALWHPLRSIKRD